MNTRTNVIASVHNEAVDRCVDVFLREDGTYGYKEFRRDPEDQGTWYLTAFNTKAVFASKEDALHAASRDVAWLKKSRAT